MKKLIVLSILAFSFIILFVSCQLTYIFENRSSHTITITPEYGDEFIVFDKSTKKLKSSHSDMRFKYSPSNRVKQESSYEERRYIFVDQ